MQYQRQMLPFTGRGCLWCRMGHRSNKGNVFVFVHGPEVGVSQRGEQEARSIIVCFEDRFGEQRLCQLGW